MTFPVPGSCAIKPAMQASSQIDSLGQEVRQASMISARSRGLAAIHSSIWRVSESVGFMAATAGTCPHFKGLPSSSSVFIYRLKWGYLLEIRGFRSFKWLLMVVQLWT